jgi:hypothetical protein
VSNESKKLPRKAQFTKTGKSLMFIVLLWQ